MNEANDKFMEIFPDDKKEVGIYRILGKKITQEDLEYAYSIGLIPMSELEDGVIYRGYCRNASKARWNAGSKTFTYMRYKFTMKFEEEIVPPELDEGYDIFVAVEKLEDTDLD